ncbi:MAG: hypothetical protein A2571_00720 [Candidatus Vogelbacteria bacterium RIFOXYD1_FULL_44_32]|uniref:Uncharacterized protein n=1 Tax=Candidatus Vogelbacteria bacterium RIFOXYD1_FULL_44_32 TaxID=1802438 RepID=A0A1G2QE76_9BACT|nr:MAG: hypothetical protein A2571_00720 [Candidatus Vogelbacteria bacterium RIFOXYD1_FULL_44_32]
MTKIIKIIIISLSLTTGLALAEEPLPQQPAGAQSGYVLLSPSFIGANEGDTVGPSGTLSFAGYLQKIYITALSIAVFAAIITFVYAGFMYLWPKPGEKTEAKAMMWQAMIGLVLALTSYLILYTVNPNLLKFDSSIFGGLKSSAPAPAPAPVDNSMPITPDTPIYNPIDIGAGI